MKAVLRNLVIAVLLTIAPAHADERTWTSEDGKKLVGDWVRDEADAVVLKIKNKEFTIPLSRLSEADRAWIAERSKAEAERAKEFEALAGTIKSFPKNSDQPVAFHVYFPSKYSSAASPPLLIIFSPGGDGRGILNQFKESCESVGWIGVGCDTFRNGVDSSELDPLFTELLPIIESSVKHDPQRLYMGGMSGGAARAFEYTAQFDRPWKGVVSCGGWLQNKYDLRYPRKMAVAWVNGDTDKNANGYVEPDTAVLEKRSCKTRLFSFPGGHVVGPPEVLSKALKWIDETSAKAR